jgi:hypothetical protein
MPSISGTPHLGTLSFFPEFEKIFNLAPLWRHPEGPRFSPAGRGPALSGVEGISRFAKPN